MKAKARSRAWFLANSKEDHKSATFHSASKEGASLTHSKGKLSSQYVLNFAVVSLSGAIFKAHVLPFHSGEQLRALQDEREDSHVVARSHNSILAVPLTSSSRLTEPLQAFEVGEQASIVARLIRAALVRFIIDSGHRLQRDNPPRFMNRTRDLVADLVQIDDHPFFKDLSLFPMFTLSSRMLRPRIGDPTFGIQIDCRLSVEMRSRVSQLIDWGLDVRGKYVVQETGDDATTRIAARRDKRRLVGRVVALSQSVLCLDDTLGPTEVSPDDVWLEPRFENLIECVQGVAPDNKNDILSILEERRSQYMNAERKFEKVLQVAKHLATRSPLKLSNDLEMSVGELYRPSSGRESGKYRFASPPDFVFDVAKTKTHKYPRSGLELHGPFDVEIFPAKHAKIVVVVPAEYRGEAELFFRQFRDGLHAGPYGKGFTRAYHLSGCDLSIETFPITEDEAGAYRSACITAIEKYPESNLAFVVVESRHKNLLGDRNPYLVSKSTLMGQGIPVQEVNIETIREGSRRSSGLPYTLGNIALASYAKMGGTPFVIATGRVLSHELIIGMGSATIRDSRVSSSERLVGITTVFTADGNYLLSNTSKEVDYDRYESELLVTLRDLIEEIRKRNAWQAKDNIRLIFHIFKPIRDIEAKAVKALVSDLTADFEVEYAFVHVGSGHDWFIFDTTSSGKGSGRSVKGKYVPNRGLIVPLGSREALVTVTGPTELKLASHGTPRPVLIDLHRESTFRDLDYLAEQVYKFTCLSWRTFLPSGMPVTISYSELIASLLGRLRAVKNWNPDVLRTKLRMSRWFL